MKLMKTTAAAVCAAMTLNGCTALVWKMNDPFSETATRHEVAKDEIQAFGVVKQANSQLAQGSLVMMGRQNWFVVNPDDSARLQGVLEAKLDKAFQIVGAYTHQPLDSLPVRLKAADGNDFSTSFCLRYDTADATDTAKLKALSFEAKQPGKQAKNRTPYYIRCENASGRFYRSPPDYRADYRFETPFPVTVSYTATKKHVDAAKLVSNIAMTPLTLAGDAAAAVVKLAVLPLRLLEK
ncbi:hypothetical protein [Neisseria sp.]|uniref:hypothetical protein n=1 Tax=Neisseria sp. TaxID=192066 RepID=UPI0026DBB42F|nr:hypothetical protein [Neisseria sp.]MDO4908198.1 hypothetical protein [Neisseria sp.]